MTSLHGAIYSTVLMTSLHGAIYRLSRVLLQVVQARPVGARVVVEAKPANYVLLSVIVLVVFCWVFGLIGLIVGIQVYMCPSAGLSVSQTLQHTCIIVA